MCYVIDMRSRIEFLEPLSGERSSPLRLFETQFSRQRRHPTIFLLSGEIENQWILHVALSIVNTDLDAGET